MRTILALLTAAMLAPLALAQTSSTTTEDEGCVRSNPCPWVVDVDDKGFQFYIDDEFTFTVGDWYELMVFSDDANRSHTISLSGHEVSVTVGPDGFTEDPGAFQFDHAGTFTLRDSPTNDEITVHVTEEDAVEAEDGAGTDDDKEGAPGLPLAFLALALVGLAALRRP